MRECCEESIEDENFISKLCEYRVCQENYCVECRCFISSESRNPLCPCPENNKITPDEFSSSNSQHYFEEIMACRNQKRRPIYAAGIKAMDNWYGDKSYREFDSWAYAIDQVLMAAENWERRNEQQS